MLFNSIEFLFFLPVVYIIYWLLNKNLKLQNVFVVFASYLFYGWWDWRFLFLIAFTSFCSWGSGLLIERSRKPKVWLLANVIVNLLVLCLFKYYNFFVESFTRLFGISNDALFLNIILPVGISFYTFQALSYSIDVYRKRIEPTHDIVSFFAFVSFFPQLVAGPIERATNLLPQFQRPRFFDWGEAVDGGRQILWGLFKKMVVADNIARIVDPIWTDVVAGTASGLDMAVAVILFPFQIYGDFSGYSDIAIGTAKLFGIRLKSNFLTPYFSRSVAEFWKRWHISLNTWFVDYVYIPLGGSRPEVKQGQRNPVAYTKMIVARNTFVIFLLSGLWHGANWTYVLWGLYHALLFLPLILLGKNRRYQEAATWRDGLKILLTFVLVAVGWVVFRAPSVTSAWNVLTTFPPEIFRACYYVIINSKMFPVNVAILLLLVIDWIGRKEQYGFACVKYLRYKWLRIVCYYAIVVLCILLSGKNETFIYFQF